MVKVGLLGQSETRSEVSGASWLGYMPATSAFYEGRSFSCCVAMVVNALSSETIALTEKRMDMVLDESRCPRRFPSETLVFLKKEGVSRVALRLLLAPVTLGVTTISWVTGMLEPKMILPTSPSFTAVQDRVLQAAAKHESQPADSEGIQGQQARDSSDQVNEKLDISEA